MMIEAQHLGKTYAGPVDAVRELSFSMRRGEVLGLLGPNGAGKTTTMRMLATLERPSRGTASIAGRDLRRDPKGVRAVIGLVAQSGGTRPHVTVRDELALQARLHRLSTSSVGRMLDAFDLGALAARPAATLSGGQRRRLDLALGLIHEPEVLLLDEPTAALDPPSRMALWDRIRALHARGTTVVLSTHHLEEADTLCDRVLILDRGALIAEDEPARLKQRLGRDTVVLGADPGRARSVLASLPGVRSTGVDGDELRIGCEDGERLVTQLVLALHDAGIETRSLRVERPTLDDVFLALTDA
jgi:ABC-2 type transport system ATP-binding protein